MTLVGEWTCDHNGCLKHRMLDLSLVVGHRCCGRCAEGQAHKTAAWGDAPLIEHAYYEGLVTPGVCTVCGEGPH